MAMRAKKEERKEEGWGMGIIGLASPSEMRAGCRRACAKCSGIRAGVGRPMSVHAQRGALLIDVTVDLAESDSVTYPLTGHAPHGLQR